MANNEQTAAQVQRIGFVADKGEDTLRPRANARKWFKKVREMRLDPTVSLVRRLIMAPALAADLSYESDADAPEGAVELIKGLIDPMRIHIIDTAFRGCIDFGWQPYELIFDLDDSGNLVIKKMKPLLQDFTQIRVDPETGAYNGLIQGNNDPSQGGVELEIENTFVHAWDVEGTDWYGEALMRSVEAPYDDSQDVRQANSRYDNKVAGSHWVIYYPLGRNVINGTEKDNGEIAEDLLKALKSSGSISIPSGVDPSALIGVTLANPQGWRVELITDGGAASTGFTARQQYLDALKARAFGVPERAVLEGQFGTKAEAEAHGDMAVVIVGMRNEMLWQGVNWHIVNRVLRFNYGEQAENTVWVKPAPLNDAQLTYYRNIYNTVFGNPDGFAVEYGELDMPAIRDKLGLPVIEPQVPTAAPSLLPLQQATSQDTTSPDTNAPSDVLAQVS